MTPPLVKIFLLTQPLYLPEGDPSAGQNILAHPTSQKSPNLLDMYLPEGDPSAGQNILALGALGGNLVLKALDTVDVLVVGDDEGLAPNLNNNINYFY